MISRDKLEYFQKRLELIWGPYLEFEEKIEQMLKDADLAIRQSDDEKTQGQIIKHYNEVDIDYRNALYSSTFIVFCSLAEHIVKEITKEIVPEYESEIRRERGDWLVKNLNLIKNEIDLNVNENDVELLSCYIKVRNCLIHDGGIVSNSKGLEELKGAISKIQEVGEQGNDNLLELTNNGHLLLRCDLVSDVYCKVEDVLSGILSSVSAGD
jgi:hypothetical protein